MERTAEVYDEPEELLQHTCPEPEVSWGFSDFWKETFSGKYGLHEPYLTVAATAWNAAVKFSKSH